MLPYVGFGLLPIDTQPWALLLSILILMFLGARKKLIIPSSFAGFLITTVVAFLSFIYFTILGQSEVISGLTSLTYYISTPFIVLAVINLGLPRNLKKHLFIIFFAWIIFAFIQLYNPGVIELLINLVRYSQEGGRGLTSLSPEPTWYARSITLLLVLSIILYFNELLKLKSLIIFFLIGAIEVLFFASSFTGFFYFSSLTILFLILNEKYRIKNILIIYSGFIAILVFFLIGTNYFPNNRVFYIFNQFSENWYEITKYGGFNMRAMNAPMAFYVGIIENSGLGKGVGVIEEGLDFNFNILGETILKTDSGRSHGGLITFIYQIGVFSIFWYISFYLLFSINKTIAKKHKWLFILIFTLLLFFEGSAVNPIAAYIIAVLIILEPNQQRG